MHIVLEMQDCSQKLLTNHLSIESYVKGFLDFIIIIVLLFL